MTAGNDVYDLAPVDWCALCDGPHEPCEVDDDGIDIGGLCPPARVGIPS